MQGHKLTFSTLAVASAIFAGTIAADAAAQQKRRAPAAIAEPAACAALHSEYDMASKRVSLFAAQAGIASGAESSRSRQKSADSAAEANTTAGLLRDNKCKPPAYAPTAARYYKQALDCWTAPRVGLQLPAACVLENWRPE